MHSDKPIRFAEDDEFGRGPHAEKLAKVLAQRDSAESFVVGVFGPWGTGKSSFLTILKDKLSKVEGEQFITVDFNPWLFNSRSELLTEFFNVVAKAAKGSLPRRKNDEDKNKIRKIAERAWDRLKKNEDDKWYEITFGQILGYASPSIPYVGKSGSKVAERMAPGLEKIRNRLISRLTDLGRPVVVFIDDIDRLEKEEVYLILKLVKLVGDLPHLTYVLSFDRNMVATQIADRFGGGDAGNSFLEKIVQLPVHLPPILRERFIEYWSKKILEVFEDLKVHEVGSLPNDPGRLKRDSDLARIRRLLGNHLYSPKASIRVVLKHCNSLRYALMSIQGEIDLHDLVAIESLRLDLPSLHAFIWENPESFLSPYSVARPLSSPTFVDDEERIKSFHKDIAPVVKNVDRFNEIAELLCMLFPVLNRVYGKGGELDVEELIANLRVGARKHFDKYFTHVRGDEDISEKEFKEVMKNILDGK